MVSKIRKLRRAQDLTQVQLAEKAGVSRASIARYEANETVPSVEALRKVANALGTTIDYLIAETPDEVKQC